MLNMPNSEFNNSIEEKKNNHNHSIKETPIPTVV